MAEASTLVYDATDKILGRLASLVAKQLISARKAGHEQRVIIYNAEHAVVSGPRTRVLANYGGKYKLNHPRKGTVLSEDARSDTQENCSRHAAIPEEQQRTGRAT